MRPTFNQEAVAITSAILCLTDEFLAENIRKADYLPGTIGIAQTRWATHGAPEIKNTHPQFSHDILAIVHNGIIENYRELKSSLIVKGTHLFSRTDAPGIEQRTTI